ncbi:hypothetical protein EGR_07961 [Echinococcus granulosus]|uniref:Uncharacterized protein n=1 Tax=Echinococcus granulosus TaxID=6210 RepID=W6UGE2_ECHGR|nr:hypothetical protein EGR_07961 [Echinococcus granulosus]EUB57212.1 hypothetical protein EGR_07961 [Echinococcus granulosus]
MASEGNEGSDAMPCWSDRVGDETGNVEGAITPATTPRRGLWCPSRRPGCATSGRVSTIVGDGFGTLGALF